MTDADNLAAAEKIVREVLGDHVRRSHILIGSIRQALNMKDVGRDELRDAALRAKTRLDDFADQANAGQVHYSARELKRKIGAAFTDLDAVLAVGASGRAVSEEPK